MILKNIYSNVPKHLSEESFETILRTGSFRIERIVSRAHSTTPGEWLDQETNEWVLLLTGSARILFQNETETIAMKPGDYLHIPAHKLHRVEWTEPESKTIWLALHY